MQTRSILIKFDNEFVYLSDSIRIGYDKTNLPKRYFSFKNERSIYFEVQQLSFEKKSSTLIVKVINYTARHSEDFSKQVPKQNINALEFEKMDWTEFMPLVYSYTLSRLQETFYNIQFPLLSPPRESAIETFQKVIKVNFENGKFHDGYICFTANLKEYGIVRDFSITNIHLRQEFEYIKSWFIKKLGKSFIVTFNINAIIGNEANLIF